MKTKVLIHTNMIVVRVARLRGRLAYVYASYTYDSHTEMNHTSTLIIRVGFLRARQSYAYGYETETHIFTSHFDAHANHTHRNRTACQSYAKDSCKRLTHIGS
jgi:hypothetical protein